MTSVARVITFTISSLHQLVFTMPGGCVMRMSNWRRSVFLSARGRPAETVTLDAGAAGTYAQRAIPGSDPGPGCCTFRPL